jgi:hypothetical protein
LKLKKFIIRPTLAASTDGKKEGELIEKAALIADTETHIQDVKNLFHYHLRHSVFPDVADHD